MPRFSWLENHPRMGQESPFSVGCSRVTKSLWAWLVSHPIFTEDARRHGGRLRCAPHRLGILSSDRRGPPSPRGRKRLHVRSNQVAVPLDGAAATHDPLAVPCRAAGRACVSDLCASRHPLLTLSMTGQFLGHLGASRSALVVLLECGMSRHPRSSTTVPLVGGSHNLPGHPANRCRELG